MSTLALIPPLRYEAYSYLSDVSDFAHLTQVSAGQKRDMQSFLNLIWRKFARMKNASETFPYMFEVYRECQGNMTLAKIRELYNGILHLETLRLRGMQSDEEFTHLKQQHLPKSLGANPEFYMPIENERWRHLPISIADQF